MGEPECPESYSSARFPEIEALLRVPRGRDNLCSTRNCKIARIGYKKETEKMPMAGDGWGVSLGAAPASVLVLSFIEVKWMSRRRDVPSIQRYQDRGPDLRKEWRPSARGWIMHVRHGC